MRVGILGPLRVYADDGAEVEIGGTRLRGLLARLALDAGRPVSVDALLDGLWGDQPPTDAANALQSLVSRLRRVLRAAGDGAVRANGQGYTLDLNPDAVDAHRFERLARDGKRALGNGKHAEAAELLAEAAELWRGSPLDEFAEASFAAPAAARLVELGLAVLEDRAEAELHLGGAVRMLPALEEVGAKYPLRERLTALRMRVLHAAGRQSEALRVYEQTRNALADELGIDPSTELSETHLAILRGELAEPSRPVARPEPGSAPLPTQLTSFVGRDVELAQLDELLHSSRLVTLVGPGGAGKTRLATEAAQRHRAHEHQRVWFVPLAGLADGADLAGVVLTALGAADVSTREVALLLATHDAVARLAELLGVGESLLVLDNCEHLIGRAAALCDVLLANCPGLRIMVTSREPLAITGEALCVVGSLAVPELGSSTDQAKESPAVRLFLDRARAVRPDFVLDDSVVNSVVEICRQLDGLPLAVELAAARLRAMTAAQIAERLVDRFRLLTSGSRTALPRQRTLRAVVEWSWDLLEEPERLLAMRMSVFAAGATVTALEQVCADDRLPASDVLYVLASLTDKSIVDNYVTDTGRPRYRMLETIRAYADERLVESGERSVVQEAFAAHCVDYAQEQDLRIRGSTQLEADLVFDAEHGNFLAALHWFIDAGRRLEAVRLLRALSWYWIVTGRDQFFGEFVPVVRKMSGEVPGWELAVLRFSELAVLGPGNLLNTEWLRGMAKETADMNAMDHYAPMVLLEPVVAMLGGDIELGERRIAHGYETSDGWAQAAVRLADAFAGYYVGDAERGRLRVQEAHDRFRELGDQWGLMRALLAIAGDYSVDGEHAKAIETHEEGMRILRELGTSQEDLAVHLTYVVQELGRSGDLEQAWARLREAEGMLGPDSWDGFFYVALSLHRSELYRLRGDFDAAAEVLAGLPDDARDPGVGLLHTLVRQETALVAIGRNEPELARVEVRTGFLDARTRRDLPDLAGIAESLGMIKELENADADAAKFLGIAVALRGLPDRGSPVRKALVDRLTERLGEPAYTAAYQSGVDMSISDALAAMSDYIAGD
ncbi:AfsR/SARP family transcriptional regulator [Tamaricihabitans halophyticus]|uniref:AfsR/SARP family transcriptional regulator n=1 Tax=Tamaricihabitans halophyticus TaxID=1262583 RepID=UPI0010442F1C|nr:BTAD domain-containing putative transcriptional regulator [Tamaricihabitans halophyticus]